MGILLDGLLALLAALGVVLGGGLLFGRLLYPMPGKGLWIVVPGRGDGSRLEWDLRGLMWLRGLGFLRCSVVIADVDLTPQGRELALHLAQRWENIVLWPAGQLHELL